jgi:hypothetical protein
MKSAGYIELKLETRLENAKAASLTLYWSPKRTYFKNCIKECK